MPGQNVQVVLNGAAVWAYVVELDGGLKVRLAVDDCEQLGLFRGQPRGVSGLGSLLERGGRRFGPCDAQAGTAKTNVWLEPGAVG